MRVEMRDYLPLLRRAVAEARDAGLAEEAGRLEEACFAAFTTSSEMTREHARAIRRFLREAGSRAPRSVAGTLRVCLNETELAAGGFRRLIALLRRPGRLE